MVPRIYLRPLVGTEVFIFEEVRIVQEELKKIKERAMQAMSEVNTEEALNEMKVKFLGKEGELNGRLKGIGK